jgi:hypothetical protein
LPSRLRTTTAAQLSNLVATLVRKGQRDILLW